MFEDRLQNGFINNGYQKVNSNAPGIYLFHRSIEDRLNIVSVMHVFQGNELSISQYEHILAQIKASFRNSYSGQIKLLSLIITDNPGGVKHLATIEQEDSHWIIDIRANRLIIYETQTGSYTDLQRMIEEVLTEEQSQQNNPQTQSGYYQTSDNQGSSTQSEDTRYSRYQQGRMQPRGAFWRYQLTPFTMGIIALNVLVYLVTHFTPLFGGPDTMLTKGALSWYFVVEEKEYYRVLTSIFMHADWSHLANNMIVLLFVGGNLERIMGRFKYLLLYFATGILAGITSIGYNMWKEYAEVVAYYETTLSIGASGAIFGVVGAVLFIVIINKGRLREISMRQMVWFVFLSLYSGIVNSQIDQAAHVGGFIAGFILAVILYRKPKIIQGLQ